MEVVTNEGRDRAFNEAVLRVQQQFLAHRERTSLKLQKLEDTIELARQKMQVIRSITVQRYDEGFVNTLGVKTNSTPCKTVPKGKVPSGTIPTLKPNFPKFKGAGFFEGLQECGYQLADFGIGNKTQEWSNHPAEQENAHDAWKAYTGDPIFDEEQGEGQECWPEEEFILAAINGGNLDAPNPLQTEICSNERSVQLAEFSNLDLNQKNVSPGDMNIVACNVLHPSKEERSLEMSGVDHYVFNPMESSTANCKTVLGYFLTWSTKDKDRPYVGNNSNGKFKLNGHSPFLEEKGIYNDLTNLLEPSMPTKEDVHNLKTVLMAEKVILLELTDPSSPLSCLSGELERIGGDMKMWFLTTANSHGMGSLAIYCENNGMGSLAIYCENNVLIFDPGGGYVQNTNSRDVIIVLTEKIRHQVTLDDVVIFISICGQLGQLQDIICWKLTIHKLMMEHQLRMKVIMIQMVNAYGIQGVGHQTDRVVSEINQQHVDIGMAGKKVILKYCEMGQLILEMDRIMRLEYHETSKKSVERTIFDPGGYIICVYEAQLVDGTAGILIISKLLHEVCIRKDLLLEGQEGIVVDVLSEMYVIQVKRSLEVHDPP